MKRIALAGAAFACLAVCGSAAAGNQTVWAGPSGLVKQLAVPKDAEVAQFFPATVTINAGDSVTFQTKEGHSITFPGAKHPRTADFIKQVPGKTYTGVNGPDGQPFWFNGKPEWGQDLTPVLAPAGTVTVADATSYHSRVIAGPDPTNPPGIKPSTTYTFPKPGVYHYMCLFHMPSMRGTVVVRPAGAPSDSAAQVQLRAIQQVQKAVATTKALETAPVPAGTIRAGASKDSIDLFRFTPSRITVKAGTPLRIVAGSAGNAHSVMFVGSDKKWVKAYFKAYNQFPVGILGGELPYATDPAGTAYDGTNHGSGFFGTQALDRDPAITISPASTTITFSKPGTYTFYCEIHFPDMKGTIVVTK